MVLISLQLNLNISYDGYMLDRLPATYTVHMHKRKRKVRASYKDEAEV